MIHFDAVFENLTEGVLIANARGRILRANRAAVALHGYRDEQEMLSRQKQFTSNYRFEAFDGRLLPLEDWPIMRALRGERYANYEVWVNRLDIGRRYLGSYNGTPIFDANRTLRLAVLTIRDVAAEKHVERALRESEERYQRLVDLSPYPVAVHTGSQPVYVNRALLEMFRVASIPELGATIDRVHPDSRPLVVERIRRMLQDGETMASTDERWVRPDGSVIDVEVASSPLPWEGDRAILVVARDVTEQKAAERRQHFLIQFADALRDIEDPQEIKFAAALAVAQHFGVARAAYGEFEPDGIHVRIDRDFSDGIPSIAGRYRMSDFGPLLMSEAAHGHIIAVADVAEDPRTREHRENYEAVQTRSFISVPLIRQGRLVAFLGAQDTGPRAWSREDIALIEQVAERTSIALDRSRAERDLREAKQDAERSLARLAAIFDHIHEGLVFADPDGNTEWNPAAYTILGVTNPDQFSRRRSDYVPLYEMWKLDGSRLPFEEWPLSRVLRGEPVENVELEVRRAEIGYRRIIAFNGAAIRDREGCIALALMTFRDITLDKKADEHQKLLLAELSHRVKNTLAVVQAMATQTLHGETSIAAFAEAFKGRIFALAAAHSLLTETNWDATALSAVIEQAVAPHRRTGEDIFTIAGPDLALKPQAALSLMLVLHELGTNAAKYGSLSRPEGRIAVTWRIDDRVSPPELRLTWRETGGPAVRPPTRRSFGISLIERSISYDLEGDAELDFRLEGLVCEIRVPWTEQIFQEFSAG